MAALQSIAHPVRSEDEPSIVSRVIDWPDPARLFRKLPERLALTIAVLGSLGALAFFVGLEVSAEKRHLERFNWILLTGLALGLACLWWARGQRSRFEAATLRLADRAAIQLERGGRMFTKADVDPFLRGLDRRAQRWAHRVGLLGAIALGASALVFLGAEGKPNWLLLGAPIGGYFAARTLQDMARFGWLRSPWLIDGRTINVKPGHIDRAAGLKPVGSFYFSQALILGLPALYLTAWLVVLYAGRAKQHEALIPMFLGLLLVVLALQVFLFLRPMWTTHVAMSGEKRKLLSEADGIASEILAKQDLLRREPVADKREKLSVELAGLQERYAELENMPTWPLDPGLRTRFTVQVAAFGVPLLSQAIILLVG